ncbi:MAG: hypothetical protein ACRCYU_15440 [Nocardioides sp.]
MARGRTRVGRPCRSLSPAASAPSSTSTCNAPADGPFKDLDVHAQVAADALAVRHPSKGKAGARQLR